MPEGGGGWGWGGFTVKYRLPYAITVVTDSLVHHGRDLSVLS